MVLTHGLQLADGSFNKRGMSLRAFLNSVDQFRIREYLQNSRNEPLLSLILQT